MTKRALLEKLNCYFSEVFCKYWNNFHFGKKTEHSAIILLNFEAFLKCRILKSTEIINLRGLSKVRNKNVIHQTILEKRL